MNILSSKVNSYFIIALLMSLIIAFLAYGINTNIQPSRVVTFISFLLLIPLGFTFHRDSPPAKYFLRLSAFWFMWGVLSLLWAPNLAHGIQEIAGISLGFFTVAILLSLSSFTPHALNALRLGWLSAFVLTLPIAIYELTTGDHLASSYGEIIVGGFNPLVKTYASANFGNPNTYSAFILLCVPFLFWSYDKTDKLLLKFALLFIISIAFVIMIANTTRLGLISLVLQFVAWLVFRFMLDKKSGSILAIFLLYVGISFFVWTQIESSHSRIDSFRNLIKDESVIGRTALLFNGLIFLERTMGIGVGAGGFEQSMIDENGLFNAGGIVNPHNLWIEVSSQYGVVVAILFIAWLLYCFTLLSKAIIRMLKSKNSKYEYSSYIVILMIGFPLGFMINSSYLNFTMFWVAIGTVAVASNIAYIDMKFEY